MKVKYKVALARSTSQTRRSARAFNEALVHQVVTAYLAGAAPARKRRRRAPKSSGGGKKPWKQKGTGRARVGSIRSPIWVGGGRAFAARPRDFEQKVNRKMYRGAMRSVLSELLRQERLVVTPELALSAAEDERALGQARAAAVHHGPRSSSKRST